MPWLHVGRFGFDLNCLSTSNASPNDYGIVIIVDIIIGKLDAGVHRGADYSTKFLFFAPRFVPACFYFGVMVEIRDVGLDVEQGSPVQHVDALNCQGIPVSRDQLDDG